MRVIYFTLVAKISITSFSLASLRLRCQAKCLELISNLQNLQVVFCICFQAEVQIHKQMMTEGKEVNLLNKYGKGWIVV